MTIWLMTLLLVATDPPAEQLPTFSEELLVVAESPLLERIPEGEPVHVVFGAGELQVKPGDGPEVRAEVEWRCPPSRQKRCGDIRKRLRVEAKQTDEGLVVRLAGVRASLLRRLQATGRVSVPRTSPLFVRAGYGDVDIEAGNRSLRVTMKAGDLRVEAPRSHFTQARARARFGDAAVHADGRRHSKRSKLVGAVGQWESGQGGGTVDARLRFGDARVILVGEADAAQAGESSGDQ